jgi:hypothetical protein
VRLRLWTILTGKNRRTRRKTYPSNTLSPKNPTWIDSSANPGLRSERPATNRLSHGTASMCVVSVNGSERFRILTLPSQGYLEGNDTRFVYHYLCRKGQSTLNATLWYVSFMKSYFYFFIMIWSSCRSQWPRSLRRRSAAARLLGSRVRIPLRASMFVCCVYTLCCPV